MKETYIISYDLSESDDYEDLYSYIKSFGTWAHITESLWAVKSEKSAFEIRNELKEKVSKGSRLFVIKSGVEAAWTNVICRNQWLKDHL